MLNQVLIVCRDRSSLKSLSAFKPEVNKTYILASDDPEIHDFAKSQPWLSRTIWLEKIESFFVISSDVISILDEINVWLKSLADPVKGFDDSLMSWIRHCEGGMTTQRIQDALLLIRSYQAIFSKHKLSDVVLFSSAKTSWEDELLVLAASGFDIKVDFNWAGNSFWKKFRWFVLDYAIFVARIIFILYNFLRNRLFGGLSENLVPANEKNVIFQICSSQEKHVNNIVPVMEAIAKNGYRPIALTWCVNDSYKEKSCSWRFREKRIRSIALETFTPLTSLIKIIPKVIFTYFSAWRKRSVFFALPKLQYNGIPLGKIFWPSIIYFIFSEVWVSYLLKNAVKSFFAQNSCVGFKPWGGGVLAEGRLLMSELKNKDNPLSFGWGWSDYESPYHQKIDFLDLHLAAGEFHKQYLQKMGVSAGQIGESGLSQFDNIESFKKNSSREESFDKLKIPKKFSRYFLFDSGAILRGFMASSEQALTLKSLIIFAKEHPQVALMIKPHPSHKDGFVESICKAYDGPKNVFLIEKSSSFAYHSLNVADLLITKNSFLGIEMMIFGKPVVSLLLDHEEKFKIYGCGVDYFFQVDLMIDLLQKISESDSFFQLWQNDLFLRSANFVESLKGTSRDQGLKPSEIMASEIVRFLNEKCRICFS